MTLVRRPGVYFAVFVFLFVATATAQAQGMPTELVTCGDRGQAMCNVCNLVGLAQNVLNFFVFFSTLVAALLFVNAGVLYLFSPSNPGNVSKAHRIFTNTLVGMLIILTSWLVVGTVMTNLYGQEGTWGPWNRILCAPGGATPIQAPVTPTAPVATAPSTCTDLAAVAARYNEPYPFPPAGAPGLSNMISCYRGDATVASLLDTAQIYTTDRNNSACNYTRGNPVCTTRCSHSVNSCHYGGRTGSLGAMGVDFNATGNRERELCRAIAARRSVCGGVINWEIDHTHVSLSTCDNAPSTPCP